MRPESRRRMGFPEFLDRRLDDARLLNRTLRKLDELFDLNCDSAELVAEHAKDPDFARLTLGAPRIDRNDPLGLLKGLTKIKDDPADPAP